MHSLSIVAAAAIAVTSSISTAAPVTVTFDGLDAAGGAVGGEMLRDYLSTFGMTTSSGAVVIEGLPHGIAGPTRNVLTGGSGTEPARLTLSFSQPVSDLSFIRAGAVGISGVFAPWTATAHSASGAVLDSVEEPRDFVTDRPSAVFSLSAQDITRLQFTAFTEGAGTNIPWISSLSFNTPDPAPPPPPISPVSVATLAKLANDVYNPFAAGADGFSFRQAAPESGDFRAVAYQNGDNIVISVRGTSKGKLAFAVKNLLADASWVAGTPDPVLRSYVNAAAGFLRQVAMENPNANITITGHSLGGAIAQLLGAAANTRAISFDAPGPATFTEDLVVELIGLGGIGGSTASEITNYRLYGDQISFVGTQLGQTRTVDQHESITREEIDANLIRFLDYHDMDNLQGRIVNGGLETATLGAIGRKLQPGLDYIASVLIDSAQLLFTFFVGQPFDPYILDPLPGSAYEFSLQGGSPPLFSIKLPILDDIQNWQLTYQSNNVWSAPEIIAGTIEFFFPEGAVVDSLRFTPLDSNQRPVFNDEFFNFAVGFGGTGTVQANLFIAGQQLVPEPETLPLLIVALAAFLMLGPQRRLLRGHIVSAR